MRAGYDDAPRQGERPRTGHLHASARSVAYVAEFVDQPQPIRGLERLYGLQALALIVAGRPQLALGRMGAQPCEPVVEIGGEESEPSHFSIRHDVYSGILLIAH